MKLPYVVLREITPTRCLTTGGGADILLAAFHFAFADVDQTFSDMRETDLMHGITWLIRRFLS